jgi:cysteinyl-tRNA synthetase
MQLYNTISRTKEKFVPLDAHNVRLYVCGPTVYDYPHVGNARPLIVFDVLFRVLREIYGQDSVQYVRNITDIDDKIIETAKKNNISINELTNKVTKDFHSDCNYLNCLAPSVEPKATDHINEMIELTKKLLELNFAYIMQDHVYFEVSKFDSYGKLSNKKIIDLVAGARVEISDLKKNPADFVLWKPSSVDEPGWNSPWGRGRPGWHLECSAMAKKYLGTEFDIHAGGLDLIFPHHENEIAQSVCAHKTKVLANFWMHNGYVTVNKEKMSKSLGNFITINELKNKYDGQVIRLAMLSTHYRQPFDWNEKNLETSYMTLNKWYEFYSDQDNKLDLGTLEVLTDDLNTPMFISKMHSLYKDAVNGNKNAGQQLSDACKLLGLFDKNLASWNNLKTSKSITAEEIENLIQERKVARDNKNFSRSDEIRDLLIAKGIIIEDNQGKTSWKYK